MMLQPAASDLLGTIVAATRRIVDVRAAREPLAALASRAEAYPARAGRFRAALADSGITAPRVIAECKRRSPSRGVLRADYAPATIAAAYERAGAAAISVLTEPTFFDGALEHLQAVRRSVDIPLLRKDFIVSEYQLWEARAAGADAVLLIVAALDAPTLGALHSRAVSIGLDVLVEVHREDELSAAVDSGARIIGVNNRNLRTLDVDVTASERMAARIPQGIVRVSESGLKSPADVTRLGSIGYDAFLIGERFMLEEDPGAALRSLIEHCVGTKGRRIQST